MGITISDRVQELFADSNLSQTKFAAKVGISQPYLSQILAGKKEPEQRVVKAICSAFGVSEAWLRGESESKDLPLDEFEEYIDDVARDIDNPMRKIILAILKAYKDLDADSQDKVKEFAKSFSENLK